MSRHIDPLCCSPKFTSLIASLFLTGILNLLGCSSADRTAFLDGNYRIVERGIDGDTLVMENGERVRLIGIDTPETKHPRKSVEHFGKAPRAHKDSTQQRRTLAYVFLEDGILLNAEIIKQGYGLAYTRFPLARVEELRRLEWEAREQRR
jgi:micrococcal nuclease